jgi:hypothetical protein
MPAVSRKEQSGIQGAAVERERLSGAFTDAIKTFEQTLTATDAESADYRLAANILKHRIRSFDAPPNSWSEKVTFLVRARASDAVLDDLRVRVPPPPTTAPRARTPPATKQPTISTIWARRLNSSRFVRLCPKALGTKIIRT